MKTSKRVSIGQALGELDRRCSAAPRHTGGDRFRFREGSAALYQRGGVIAQCEFGPGAEAAENVSGSCLPHGKN